MGSEVGREGKQSRAWRLLVIGQAEESCKGNQVKIPRGWSHLGAKTAGREKRCVKVSTQRMVWLHPGPFCLCKPVLKHPDPIWLTIGS